MSQSGAVCHTRQVLSVWGFMGNVFHRKILSLTEICVQAWRYLLQSLWYSQGIQCLGFANGHALENTEPNRPQSAASEQRPPLPSPPAFIGLLHLLQWEHRCLYLLLHNMLGTTPAEAPACLAVGCSSLRFCFTVYQQKLGDNRLKLLLNFHVIILLNDSFIHLFIIEFN